MAAGVPADRVYVAKRRESDVVVVHTFDRLGRAVPDTLNPIQTFGGDARWALGAAPPQAEGRPPRGDE